VLLDWVSASVSLEAISEADRRALRARGDRIQRFNLETGEVAWETQAWDDMRSDSHHLAFHVGSDSLRVQGSPARLFGDGDAVFGAGAAAALDLRGCVDRQRAVLGPLLGVALPPAVAFKVTRVDVTGNLLLRDLAEVRAALRVLRDCEGGRYRVSQQAGDTVYWSHRSRLKAGKAYAKGPHLQYLTSRSSYDGRAYSEEETSMACRLLRLELKLGAQWWRERVGKAWHRVTADELKSEWFGYFGKMLGEQTVSDMNIEERVACAAPSDGQAKAAVACWALIKAYGWEKARAMQTKRTWYRNLKVLRAAGLGDADLSAGNVVALRRPVMELRMVNTWNELRQECGRKAA
jgi:II/X family phage/plasmid replication protein